MDIQNSLNLAVEHHNAGQLHEAESLYRRILDQQPNHADALHLLGVLAHQAGRPEEALGLIRRAAAVNPSAANFHLNLGNVLADLGRAEEAIPAYRNAVGLQPDLADAHNNLGNALAATGRRDEAIASFGQALLARPQFAEAWYNLGNVYQETGRFEQAMDCYRKALAIRPDWSPALNNLGRALSSLGRTDEAVVVFGKAVALNPGQPDFHNNLGNAMYDVGRLDDAIAAYRGALAVQAGYADAWNNLGNGYKNTGRLQQAIECYDRALAARPNFLVAESNRLFALTLHPEYSAEAILREQRLWDRSHAAPLAKFQRPHDNDLNPRRRLRIGYVSGDFRDHAVGRNLLPLFREHDRRQFEIFLYANVARADAMTGILRSYCDTWRDVAKLGDQQCADLIRADRIDILVDLSLHSWGNRLLVFAHKPAPVQATFAGYPGGTGLTSMDWRLTDPYLDPPGESDTCYVERSFRLADSFWCYDPQAMEWDSGGASPRQVGELPALQNGYITFGCLNNYCKVNDDVLDKWGRVLQSVGSSRLLMMAPPGESRRNVLEKLGRRGLGAERIDFVTYQPRQLYLAEFDRIDLGLDTLPYNGHTASLDALWMGVPVITRLGRTVVGRAGWSQLSNLGLMELAAHSDEQFVDIAIHWSTDLTRLADLRRTLRQRMLASPLTDAKRFAKNVETAFNFMWNSWREGQRASASIRASSRPGKIEPKRKSTKSSSEKSAAAKKLVDRAMRHHRAGELVQAESLYRRILAKHPEHPDALYLLGALAHQTGRHETAVDLIRRAIAAHPTPHFQNSLGAALAAMGRVPEAITAYRQAIEQKPGLAEAHNGLGEIYRDIGRWTDALACFDSALTARPDWTEAHNNRGIALWRLGRLDEAVDSLRRALVLRPQFAEAYCNLGIALRDMGKCEQAIAACWQAIALRPDFANAYSNLSLALADHKEPEAAATAARKAIELRPDFIEAYINLSAVLRITGESEEAMAACRHVIRLCPDFALAYANLATLMADQGMVEEALIHFEHALALNPQDSIVRSQRLFALHCDPNREARTIFAEHQQWNQMHALPLQGEVRPHGNDRSAARRLRIGYVSPNLRQHSVAFFLESLLESHDPASMEIFCYSQGPHPDETTARLRRQAAVWRDVTALNDPQLAELVRRDRIDILVDLAGHTTGNRLLMFARKPAPVQVTYLGYANTTGLTTIDYRFTDDYADPPGRTESLHSEQLLRLPRTFLCYRPYDDAPPMGPVPAVGTGRITFGSFNALVKINSPLVALWARILERIPGSRMILKSHARPIASARKHILQLFSAHHIDPARIDVRGRIPSQIEHLRLYDQIDIALDTFPYHGTTTTCEAMWMGVPVVTLAGQVHISRVGVSLLSNVGLTDLIARDAEDYVRLAVNLAGDSSRLIELRASLRQRMSNSPLMDAKSFAREVEAAYRRMWEKWCGAKGHATLVNESGP